MRRQLSIRSHSVAIVSLSLVLTLTLDALTSQAAEWTVFPAVNKSVDIIRPVQATQQPTAPVQPPAVPPAPETSPQTAPQTTPQSTPQTSPTPLSPYLSSDSYYDQSPFANAVSGRSNRRVLSRRLARAPELQGDSSLFTPAFFNTGNGFLDGQIVTQNRNKITTNGTPRVQDRVFFGVKSFQNAYDWGPFLGRSSRNYEQYLIGFEKVIGNSGTWSLEGRLPFATNLEYHDGDLDYQGSGVGNLALIIKHEIWSTDEALVSAGLGINTPTGSDIDVNMPFRSINIEIQNKTTYLSPFVGFLLTPTENLFVQGFFQLDIATGGDDVNATLAIDDFEEESGVLTQSTMFYFDIATGMWLYRNECSSCLTGVAALIEFHYTHATQDPDEVDVLGRVALLGSSNVDPIRSSNLTLGLHTEIAHHTAVRFGLAVPLSEGLDRTFDSEFIASIIRRF